MLSRVFLGLTLLAVTPGWSQVAPAASGPAPVSTEAAPPDADIIMLVPPPVSGQGYPTAVLSEVRSNYLDAALAFNAAHDDNVLAGSSPIPVSDMIYTISPTIALDQSTPRQHRMFNYSPSFVLYQPTTALNEVAENALGDFQFRLSPHTSLDLKDSFQKTSNVLNQSDILQLGSVSGSSQAVAVIAPFANQLNNSANAEFSSQFRLNDMVGAAATFTNLYFLNPSEATGLYDSDSQGGSGFYSHRMGRAQYVGASYQYLRSMSNFASIQSDTQTHTIAPFYTIYFRPTFSISLAVGPQHFDVVQSSSTEFSSWTPFATGSIGYQGLHANFAANYSRTVTGGGALLGGFNSSSANGIARWRITPTWIVGAASSYGIYKNVAPALITSSRGGHTVSGTVSLEHPIGERFKAEAGFTKLHQSYGGVVVLTEDPDSEREYISISYQLRRPLGR